MKKVSEKEFVRFIEKYHGSLRLRMEMSADPPMVIYEDANTGELVGRYPEISLGQEANYKNAYYEIKE